MTAIFLKIVNMSFSASWLILALLALRLLLRTTPKWGRVVLWGLVAVRLLVPFSIESRFSMIPGIQPVDAPPATTVITSPAGEGSAAAVAAYLSLEAILSIIWLTGVVILMVWFVVSYLRLLRRLDTGVLLRENIYQSELVADPMVVGIIRPRIYIPFRIDDHGMDLVVLHEQTHIRRGDHWWKLLAFVCLSLHWFNPLVWISYGLLCRDIELACDEAVISGLDHEGRGDYAQTLMTFSVKSPGFPVYPVGFSTVDTKGRIRAIAGYRNSGLETILLLSVCCLFLVICFLTEPVKSVPEALLEDNSAQLQQEPSTASKLPPENQPTEEALRAELEKLKQNLASYRGYLEENRDLFVQKKKEENPDDLLNCFPMQFYNRMIQELELQISSLEKQIAAL